MKTGAVITAAGMSSRMGAFKPLLKIGNLSAAEYIIQNFFSAGTPAVTLITGNNAEELEKSLSHLDIVFLRNEMYKTNEMFDSIKIGLAHLKDSCDKIFVTPVDVPLFSVDTLKALQKCNADVGLAAFKGKTGHPIILNSTCIDKILQYSGDGGLRGAIKALSLTTEYIETADQGILYDMNTASDYSAIVQLHRELPAGS